jgi:hypothetical protein
MAEPSNEYDRDYNLAGGMRLNKWCKAVDISRITAYRWRKAGKLRVIIRYGIVFIPGSEIKRFWEEEPAKRLNAPTEPASQDR